ncbi:hypothetical protein [uncultured Gammaproteobacteria bacterium]|nr:hypothetical protein [uncultured Gammaproteobacteria bacterium]CAC9631184.1 hypothetical protein [uncultured Gammaproteobacteria bacterium]
MNKDKLKEFVNALDSLSDEVKDWGVSMMSTKKPACGTPGCHSGLISIVAKDLPELQDIYQNHIYFTKGGGNKSNYHSCIWADVLSVFLGFIDRRDLEEWAQDNPKFWGNKFGRDMFYFPSAFTDDTNKKLTHRDLINHWKQVLKNIEA